MNPRPLEFSLEQSTNNIRWYGILIIQIEKRGTYIWVLQGSKTILELWKKAKTLGTERKKNISDRVGDMDKKERVWLGGMAAFHGRR